MSRSSCAGQAHQPGTVLVRSTNDLNIHRQEKEQLEWTLLHMVPPGSHRQKPSLSLKMELRD